jgi:hypothetical protein
MLGCAWLTRGPLRAEAKETLNAPEADNGAGVGAAVRLAWKAVGPWVGAAQVDSRGRVCH